MLEALILDVPVAAWLAACICLCLILYKFNRRDKLLIELPGPPKERWVTGHFMKFFGEDGVAYHENLAATYGTTVKINGAFGEEAIWTLDPVAMHSILVKDRANFERPTGATLYEVVFDFVQSVLLMPALLRMIRSVFGGGLLGLRGDEHRVHRKILNPVFTMRFLRELVCKAHI
ncbi:cytochrome P450-dit2 [Ceratobasidium sp. 394]|nr:cytochrome P450-dit2 [Ceratobasidium sp. 394]